MWKLAAGCSRRWETLGSAASAAGSFARALKPLEAWGSRAARTYLTSRRRLHLAPEPDSALELARRFVRVSQKSLRRRPPPIRLAGVQLCWLLRHNWRSVLEALRARVRSRRQSVFIVLFGQLHLCSRPVGAKNVRKNNFCLRFAVPKKSILQKPSVYQRCNWKLSNKRGPDAWKYYQSV